MIILQHWIILTSLAGVSAVGSQTLLETWRVYNDLLQVVLHKRLETMIDAGVIVNRGRARVTILVGRC